jgi:hypothetical protein
MNSNRFSVTRVRAVSRTDFLFNDPVNNLGYKPIEYNVRIIHELVIRNDVTSPNLTHILLPRNWPGATEESHENLVRIADLTPPPNTKEGY